MAVNHNRTLPQKQFLTLSANLLNLALLETTRADAKKCFRGLQEGRSLLLNQVRMEDGSLVRFELVLNASEYRGRLNFSAFRGGVSVLLHNLVQALREEQPLQVYQAEHDARLVLFGVTGLSVQERQPNVLGLGAYTSDSEPLVQLQLMYLDPAQFVRDGSSAA
jgi:hypothetical protein